MFTVGQALNDTFHTSVANATDAMNVCADGVVALTGLGGKPFDYVVTMENLEMGQRIANYSVEYQAEGSTNWEVGWLVGWPSVDSFFCFCCRAFCDRFCLLVLGRSIA